MGFLDPEKHLHSYPNTYKVLQFVLRADDEGTEAALPCQTDKCPGHKAQTGAGKCKSAQARHHAQIVGYAPDSDFGKGQKLGIVQGERTFMDLFTALLIH